MNMKYFSNENVKLYSVGLFGSWCFHKPTKTLFDCGDGVSQILRHGIFAIERVAIGHSHVDHISGLVALIGLRNKTKGSNDKPLDVLIHADDPFLRKYVEFINHLFPQESLKYKLTFIGVKPGQEIDVGNKTYIKVFKTEHTPWSVGFCVCNESYGLAEGIDPAGIGAKIRSGVVKKEDVTVRRDIKTFAYVVDSSGFDVRNVSGVREIVLDCTFLNEADRDAVTHMSLLECEKAIRRIGCRQAYLSHISPRYKRTRGKTLLWTVSEGLLLDGKKVSFAEMSNEKGEMD